MSFFKDVHTALDSRLNTLSVSIDVAWENTEYVPVVGTAFLRPTLLLAPSALMNLESLQMNEGIYQIDLLYPLDQGMGAALTTADTIFDHFKSEATLTSGGVTLYIKQIARLSTAEADEAWSVTPMEINFKCYQS